MARGPATAAERPFRLDVVRVDDSVVVTVRGDLDVTSAPALVRAMVSVMEDRPTTVVCDLGDVTFVDGRGLAALEACGELLAAFDGRLHLAHVPPACRRLLNLAGSPIEH